MGCYHYANAANAAKAKIEDLKTEKEKYVNARRLLGAAMGAVSDYSGFLSKIGSKFQSIIINDEPFDKGECSNYSKNLSGCFTNLSDVNSKIPKALIEIEKEILAQKKIIDNPYVCEYCEKKGGNYLR